MNEDIKQTIKAAGLCQCQVARKMGIFEHDLQRMLRKELKEENRNAIYKAIEELTKEE